MYSTPRTLCAALFAALGVLSTIASRAADTATAPAKADPAASALLKAAHDARQVLPDNFAGFTAELVFDDNGKQSTGTFNYNPKGKTEVQVAGLSGEPKSWLDDQVLSMMGHRSGGDFAKGDGSYSLTMTPDDGNPWGRLIQLNDDNQSSYRVRGGEIVEVTRSTAHTRFTISVLQTLKTDTGKYLPQHFTVSYRDAKTGTLQQVEGYRDAFVKVTDARYGAVWLPSRRLVIIMESNQDSPRLRVITLRNFRLN